MPRPRLEKELRKTVREYLAIAENLSVEEGPLNTLSVAPQLGFNREKLKKYGFDVEIARASERQGRNGKMSPRDSERRSYADKLHQRDSEIEAMRQRCEALVSRVCLAEGNAQRLGIDPTELWKPLPVPDRSLPCTRTGRNRMGRSASA
jgi:hypothetical protein